MLRRPLIRGSLMAFVSSFDLYAWNNRFRLVAAQISAKTHGWQPLRSAPCIPPPAPALVAFATGTAQICQPRTGLRTPAHFCREERRAGWRGRPREFAQGKG